MVDIDRVIQAGFSFGMFQHREEIEQFLRWLTRRPIGHVMEIGTHTGGTTACLGLASDGKVVSLDLPNGPWGGLSAAACDARNRRLQELLEGRFTGLLADSQSCQTPAIVEAALGAELDLLFIDGDHSYLGARHDFTTYGHFVRSGGVIAFHDVNDTLFHRDRGVMVSKLWGELRGEKHLFSIEADWGGIGAWVKP